MSTDLECALLRTRSGCGAGRLARLTLFALTSWLAGGIAAAQPGSPPTATPAAPPHLAQEKLPAAGRQATELVVGEFGRYSIRLESKQGVALQLVDRMSGPGELTGETGKRDGRLDLFLDRGAVRLLTFGPKLGRGDVRIAVSGFREIHAPEAPRLPELRLVTDELGDLEQASWWIELPERKQVVLEAAGRYLADLRLWQGGAWLVDAPPEHSQIEPVAGRPLHLCRLTADLEPGLYRLVAYGGTETAWARGGREKPLLLRYGIPRRGEAGRERMSVGPFGYERFLLPGSATLAQLELPEAGSATLELADFDPARPFEAWGQTGEITPESVPPLAQLTRESTDGNALLTVRGAVGQAYTLQHFRAERQVELTGDGDFWVGTVHSGTATDSIDASAVIFERGAKRTSALAGSMPVLSSSQGWARRFNLLAEATLFLQVAERAVYALDLNGAAQVRLEPLLLSAPDGYQVPPLRTAPTTWTLDKGLYVLTLVPTEAGIVDVAMRRKGLLDPMFDWVGLHQEPPATAALGAAQMTAIRLSRKLDYTLLVATQPGVDVGPVVRKLPLDLTEPLPLSLVPGQEIEVPFRATSRGRLTAPAEDGTALEVAVDGAAFAGMATVEPGTHRVRVRSRATDTLAASLALVSEEQASDTPMPRLDPAALAALPAFTTLTEPAPAAFDLARGESRTMLVEAASPALYTLETTGLLATSGAVRTRVQPRLASEEKNGSGRNVSLRSYLREGSYQFTVRALGESAGHLGARLRRAEVREGGRLVDGIAARTELPAGESIAYRFRVDREGDYHLHAVRLGGHLDVRLEDDQGFPPAAPVMSGDSTVHLLPGDYRLFVLPQAVPTRAVTVVERRVEAVERSGHGPFELALTREDGNLWLEPEQESSPRDPDRWRFTLPATTGVKISLDAEMEGDLRRLDRAPATGERLAFVAPGRGFAGELAAGRYELAVRCSRRNSQVRYRLSVAPDALVDGLSRLITAPAVLPVAVGEEGLVELASFGGADVRARLVDANDELLASGDDRPGDWNFVVARKLAPGNYRLRVDPVGSATADTTVSMRMPHERDAETWKLPEPLKIDLADEAVRIPLRLGNDADLLAIVAVAAEPLGLELEQRQSGAWRLLSSAEGTTPRLLLPLASGSRPELRLRLRSLDRRPGSVRLAAFAGRAPRANEKTLASGLDLPRLPGLLPPVAAAAVTLDRPGCLALEAAPEELLHSRRAGEPLAAQPGALVADGTLLWLAAPAESAGAIRVTARRAAIGREALSLRLAAGEQVRCDLAPSKGLSFVEAQALAGEPLVAAPSDGQPPAFERVTLTGRHRASTLARSGSHSVVARNAGNTPIELRLTAVALSSAPARPSTSPGAHELRLAARSLQTIPLGSAAKSVRLALGEGAAAWIGSENAPEAFGWASDETGEVSLATTAPALVLVNPTEVEIAARLDLRAPDPDDASVAIGPGARLERRFRRGGGLQLPVQAGSGAARLHLRGAEAVLIGADGSVARGHELALPAGGGTLRIEHPPGLMTLWVEGKDHTLASYGFAASAPQQAAPPLTLELDGAARLVELQVATPALLSLRSASPLAVALLDEHGEVRRFVPFEREVAFDAPLAPGTTRFVVRALAGEPLTGRLEVSLGELAPLGEGLGAATLLAPGEARGYRFQVERQGPVGVGAHADAGNVETVVFDSTGTPLGRGVVQWLELSPGPYTMALVGPAEASPALARPALVGISKPGEGPPGDVVRKLLELDRGGPPPEGRGVTGEEDVAFPFGRNANREMEQEQEGETDEPSADESDESGGDR
ncbi:MAG: hypothetical protein IPJ17_17245 [Holophagales bacterium]|nr:MAG: hypothetical protein IPJ17_17245 [Holophagales bacterium]